MHRKELKGQGLQFDGDIGIEFDRLKYDKIVFSRCLVDPII